MLVGCDVSMWQETAFDFTKNEFAIIKATEGKTYTDPKFLTHTKRAKDAGCLLGAYHFARPDNGNTFSDEADNFLSALEGSIGETLLVLDWEGKAIGCDSSWAYNWLNYVRTATGIKPFIYCSTSVIKTLDRRISEEEFPLWVAEKGSLRVPTNIEPFNRVWMWQYTSTPYDRDYFYGTREDWLSLAGTPQNDDFYKAFYNDFMEFLKKYNL